jgi:hypothetical protein
MVPGTRKERPSPCHAFLKNMTNEMGDDPFFISIAIFSLQEKVLQPKGLNPELICKVKDCAAEIHCGDDSCNALQIFPKKLAPITLRILFSYARDGSLRPGAKGDARRNHRSGKDVPRRI